MTKNILSWEKRGIVMKKKDNIRVLTFRIRSLGRVKQLATTSPDGKIVIPNDRINVKEGKGIVSELPRTYFCNTGIIGNSPLFRIYKEGIDVYTVNVLAKT